MAESEQLRRWMAEGGAAVRYETLELRSPGFSQAHYLVAGNPQSVTATLETGLQVTFRPAALTIRLPEKGVQGRETMQITLDGVTREVLQELERQAVAARAPITLVYRAYLDSDLSAPQDVRTLTLRNPTCSGSRISAEASFVDAINVPFPRTDYTSLSHPGLA